MKIYPNERSWEVWPGSAGCGGSNGRTGRGAESEAGYKANIVCDESKCEQGTAVGVRGNILLLDEIAQSVGKSYSPMTRGSRNWPPPSRGLFSRPHM